MNAPSAQLNQHQNVPQNPGQPPNYNRQQAAAPPVKKTIQHDTDVYVYYKEKKFNFIRKANFFFIELHNHVRFKCFKVGFRIVKKLYLHPFHHLRNLQ
jgi:hypothetical protein